MDGEGKIKNWILAAHPWSFPASASPSLVTISFVFYLYKSGIVTEINWTNAILAFFGAIIFHMAGNLIGDYQDFKSGVDGKEKTGPIRLIVLGVFKPKTILWYGYTVIFIGLILVLFLKLDSFLPLILIVLAGIVIAMFYYKFKYVALGDIVIFLSFGLLLALGTAYVMTDQLIWSSLLVVTPTGLLVVAILHANNTRDMILDKEAGIKTQAMKLGLEGSQITYQTILLSAYMFVAIAVAINVLHPISFVVLLSLPMALKNIRLMKMATMNDLGIIRFLDVKTAQLVLVFSLLLIVANIISSFV